MLSLHFQPFCMPRGREVNIVALRVLPFYSLLHRSSPRRCPCIRVIFIAYLFTPLFASQCAVDVHKNIVRITASSLLSNRSGPLSHSRIRRELYSFRVHTCDPPSSSKDVNMLVTRLMYPSHFTHHASPRHCASVSLQLYVFVNLVTVRPDARRTFHKIYPSVSLLSNLSNRYSPRRRAGIDRQGCAFADYHTTLSAVRRKSNYASVSCSITFFFLESPLSSGPRSHLSPGTFTRCSPD